MSDPTNPHIQSRTTPQWGLYQREMFRKPAEGQTPLFSTGVDITTTYRITNTKTMGQIPKTLKRGQKKDSAKADGTPTSNKLQSPNCN